jgi:hypothetical protein
MEAGDKIDQDNRTISGIKMCLVRVYDAKNHQGTVINVKANGVEYVLNFDEEVDIETHVKCKRATKPFAKALMDRLKLEGEALVFDWQGVKRVTQEKKLAAEKEAERLKKAEESRLKQEKEKAEQKLRDEKAKVEAEKVRLLAEKKAKEKEEADRKREELRLAEEERKRKEEEAKEAERQKQAFMSKIAGAQMGGGVLTVDRFKELKKGHGDDAGGASEPPAEEMSKAQLSAVKQWSAERKAYFWLDESNGDLFWRNPSIMSVWEKHFSEAKQAFEYKNKQTGEVRDEAPFATRYDVMWIEEFDRWRYVHKDSGDVHEDEPFY